MQDIDKKIAGLQHHISVRKSQLPYVDRGYADEKSKINALERMLVTLIKKRDKRAQG